jgi:hypothetical protein
MTVFYPPREVLLQKAKFVQRLESQKQPPRSPHGASVQLRSTTSCTFLLYSRFDSLNNRAASLFAGEFGLGSQSKDLCD